jgi:hypothetical protein
VKGGKLLKKVKVLMALLLSLSIALVMNFCFPKVDIVKAVEYHTCNDGGTEPITVSVRIHGPTITECFHYEDYERTYCQYPGCNKIVDNVLVDTYAPAHIPKLKFMYCDGTYLHFNNICSYCEYLLGTRTYLCYNHPGGHPLY